MHDIILEKLRGELERDVVGEPQVIFVLTRIRKFVVRCEKKSYHQAVKFYCDWALHIDIHSTARVSDILPGTDDHSFNNFEHFKGILNKFLLDNGLSNKWTSNNENWERLKGILFDIYSDTPLIVRSCRNEEFVISKLGSDIILSRVETN